MIVWPSIFRRLLSLLGVAILFFVVYSLRRTAVPIFVWGGLLLTFGIIAASLGAAHYLDDD